MSDKLRAIAAQRVDLEDFMQVVESVVEHSQFRWLKTFLGTEPGGSVLDGFRVHVPNQGTSAGLIYVVNGMALDRRAEIVYKASETSVNPNLLFEDINISKGVNLGANTSWKIEVEFTWTAGSDDGKAFFDPTVDNGFNCCGDPNPDGEEISTQFPTRDYPDWNVKVFDDVSDWTYEGDYLSSNYPSIAIPIAVVEVDAGGAVISNTETPNTTILEVITTKKFRVNSTRYFAQANSLEFFELDATPILNGGVNVWPISTIDTQNHVIETIDAVAANAYIIKVIDDSGATAIDLLEERAGLAFFPVDWRRNFFNKSWVHGFFQQSSALLRDPRAHISFTDNFDNSDSASGPSSLSVTEPVIRNQNRLKDFHSFLKALQLVLMEMKYGTSVNGQFVKDDAGADTAYNKNEWSGLHALGSDGHANDLAPGELGSLDEVAQARVRYPQIQDQTKQFYDEKLKDRLSADRSVSITIGDGVNSDGDFTGAQGFINAFRLIQDLDDYTGTIHVKHGYYDLRTADLTPLSGIDFDLPKGWSLTGDGSNKTHVELPSAKVFYIRVGSLDPANYLLWGQRVEGITFSHSTADNDSPIEITLNSQEESGAFDTFQIENALEIIDVGFISTLGGSSLSASGMVAITSGGSDYFNRGILFDRCKWHVVGTFGRPWLDVGVTFDALTLRNLKVRDCNFRCDSTPLYGIRITPNVRTSANDLYIIENCTFSGMPAVTGWVGFKYGCILFFNTVPVGLCRTNLHVTGCKFYGALDTTTFESDGSNAIADRNGFGVVSLQPAAMAAAAGNSHYIRVKNCEFYDMQIGVFAQNGIVSVTGCDFLNCAVGVSVGEFDESSDRYNRAKVDISSCNFNGALADFDQDDDADPGQVLEALHTIGIQCGGVVMTGFAGYNISGLTDKTVIQKLNSVNVSSCKFNGLGAGIDFSMIPFVGTGMSHNEAHKNYDLVSVSGCEFTTIAGPVVNAINFDNLGTTSLLAIADQFVFKGNTVRHTMFAAWNDMFLSGSFPSEDVTQVCQYAVNLIGWRNDISGNSFHNTGDNCFKPSGLTTISDNYFVRGADATQIKFLGVLGNEPGQGCLNVSIRGNSIYNYNNIRQKAYSPWGGPVKRYGSWAGVIFFCDKGQSLAYQATSANPEQAHSSGIHCDISDNIVDGDYGNRGEIQQDIGGYSNNGFWVGAAEVTTATAALTSVGYLYFKGNKIKTNFGKHHLFLDWSSVSDYLLGWKNILIESNDCKNINCFTSTGQTHTPWPSSATGNKVQLVHIEGYLSRNLDSAFQSVSSIVSNEVSQNPQNGIIIRNNSFECSGDVFERSNSYVSNVDEAYKAGVVITPIHGSEGDLSILAHGADLLSGPTVFCNGNQFLSCQYAFLPGGGSADTCWHYHVCTNNVFIGAASHGSSPGAGFFRGIAYLKVTGAVTDGTRDMADDEGSLTVFNNNVIMNGTCMVRQIPGIHWFGSVSPTGQSGVSYHLDLCNNVFRGRGAGGSTDDGSLSGTYAALQRSQFDFIGGYNCGEAWSGVVSPLGRYNDGSTNFSGDLYDSGAGGDFMGVGSGAGHQSPLVCDETYGNVSIKVVNNHFSGEAGDSENPGTPNDQLTRGNILSFTYYANTYPSLTLIALGAWLHLASFAGDGCSVICAGNMIPVATQLSADSGGTPQANHFQNIGSTTPWSE